MHLPPWLRRYAVGIFLVIAVIYLMFATAYFTMIFADEVRPAARDLLTLVLLGLMFVMVILVRIRWEAPPDPTVAIPNPRTPGAVYRAAHPVVSLAGRAPGADARDRFEHTVPLSRISDSGLPSADESAGYIRGLLAPEEDLGGPPDWRGAT